MTHIMEEDTSYMIPEPYKVRALRIPADGSPPHLITLETLVTEPTTLPQSLTEPTTLPQSFNYKSLLSHLKDNDKSRHVPNVMVFWGQEAWENRSHAWIYYDRKATESLIGWYYLFVTADQGKLPPNQHFSSGLADMKGDAFLLGLVAQPWRDTAEFDHVLDYLYYLRQEHLFPVFRDVRDEVVGSDIVEFVVGDVKRRRARIEMGEGEEDDQDEDDQVSWGYEFCVFWWWKG